MPFSWITGPQLPPENIPAPIPSSAITYKVDLVANTVNAGGVLVYNTTAELYDVVYPVTTGSAVLLNVSTFAEMNVSFGNLTVANVDVFNSAVANIGTANINFITADSANITTLYYPTIVSGNASADPTTPLGIATKQYVDNFPKIFPYVTGQIGHFSSNLGSIWIKTGYSTNLSRTTESNLFNVIDTNYGIGDDFTTFGLPVNYVDFEQSLAHTKGRLPRGMLSGETILTGDNRVLLIMGFTSSISGTTTNCWIGQFGPSDNVQWQPAGVHPDAAGLRWFGTVKMPDNRILVTGGFTGTFFRDLTYFGTITGNVITWAQGTSIPVQVCQHGSTLTSDNRYVQVGGLISGLVATDVTRFGVVSGTTITWTVGTPLPNTRRVHTQVTLPDGRLLVTGGIDILNKMYSNTFFGDVSGDIVTWTQGTDLPYRLSSHTMTVLGDGRILVTGGSTWNGAVINVSDQLITTRECFFGTISGTTITWTTGTPIPFFLSEHRAMIDPNNFIWLSGGVSPDSAITTMFRGKITGTTIDWNQLIRINHRLFPINDNRILSVGGRIDVEGVTECHFGNVTGHDIIWSSNTSSFPAPVLQHAHAILNDSRLVVNGGVNTINTVIPQFIRTNTWIGTVNGSSVSWVESNNSIGSPVRFHSMVTHPSGRIIKIGGHISIANALASNSVHFGDVTGDIINWSTSNSLPNARASFGCSILHDGRILVTGGHDGNAAQAQTYFGTISGNNISWALGTPLQDRKRLHKQITLPDGRIFISGGFNTAPSNTTHYGFVYENSNTITWTNGPSLEYGLHQHDMCMLKDTSIVIHGGFDGGSTRGDCHIFNSLGTGIQR